MFTRKSAQCKYGMYQYTKAVIHIQGGLRLNGIPRMCSCRCLKIEDTSSITMSQRVTATAMTTSALCSRLNNLCECTGSNELIIHTEHLVPAQEAALYRCYRQFACSVFFFFFNNSHTFMLCHSCFPPRAILALIRCNVDEHSGRGLFT